MKKLTIALVALLLLAVVGGTAFAWESWFPKKGLDVTGSVGIAFPFGIALYPGVEYVFANWNAGGEVPFAFGGAVRAMVDFDTNYGVEFGVGPAVIAHLGLKGLDLPEFLQKLDFYWGLGVAFVFPAQGWSSPVGFLTVGGFNWFFKDKMALVLEGNYFGHYGGVDVGLLFKL